MDPGGLRVATAAAVVAALGLIGPLACHGRTAQVPIDALRASPDAVAEAVLERLARRDLEGLRQLAVTEQEFHGRVWPELPASRPERNLTADYVWTDLAQKSDRHLRQIVARHGGQRWRLRAVRFEGEPTEYRTFGVWRKTVLDVENRRGDVETVRVFGSLLRQGRAYKVFSYIVD